jgi:uncharacterized protein (TIGR02270 family)
VTSRNEVIVNIIEQHAEEASFTWLLRGAAVHSPHYALSNLVVLDNRVEANIDGLRIAGDTGWEICREVFSLEEAGEVFAAAVLALESGDTDRIQVVIEAGSDVSRGIVSALGWLSYPQAEKFIQSFLNSNLPMLRRIGIAASAVHRKDPGKYLTDALSDTNPLLKARAFRAAGELSRRDLLSYIKVLISDEDSTCRFFAAWSAALLGDVATISTLKSFAESDSPHREEAVKMAARKMNISSALKWQKELSHNPDTIRLALIAAGVIGDPALIPWLIEYMAAPEMARVSGEAFTMITGVDIAYEDLEGEWPEGFEAGPSESPEDDDVALDPDEDLPWPDPELIAEWWHKNRGNFHQGTRYLLGKPISRQQCEHVLRYGYQRQRAAAAMELAMMSPGQPLFEVRTPGFRQQRLLGLK